MRCGWGSTSISAVGGKPNSSHMSNKQCESGRTDSSQTLNPLWLWRLHRRAWCQKNPWSPTFLLVGEFWISDQFLQFRGQFCAMHNLAARKWALLYKKRVSCGKKSRDIFQEILFELRMMLTTPAGMKVMLRRLVSMRFLTINEDDAAEDEDNAKTLDFDCWIQTILITMLVRCSILGVVHPPIRALPKC